MHSIELTNSMLLGQTFPVRKQSLMISQPKISPSPLKAYVVGTIDTKGEELHYVRDLIAEAGIPTVLVDVGPRSQEPDCDVRSAEVASFHPKSSSAVVVDDRGRAIDAMAQAFATFLPPVPRRMPPWRQLPGPRSGRLACL